VTTLENAITTARQALAEQRATEKAQRDAEHARQCDLHQAAQADLESWLYELPKGMASRADYNVPFPLPTHVFDIIVSFDLSDYGAAPISTRPEWRGDHWFFKTWRVAHHKLDFFSNEDEPPEWRVVVSDECTPYTPECTTYTTLEQTLVAALAEYERATGPLAAEARARTDQAREDWVA
jgi:hypothetical protein